MNNFIKHIIILIILLHAEVNIKPQPVWNYLNSGTANNLNKIIIAYSESGLILFIAGDNGTILRSSDSGMIWESVISNTNENLYSIDIPSDDTGYAAGSNGTILRTTNGGMTWAGMVSNTSSSIKCLRRTPGNLKAFAVGENGTFLKLENNVWTSSQIDTADLNSVLYESTAKLTVVGNNGLILKSTNNGLNWTRINSNTTNNLNDISDNNVVIGDNGTAFRINGTIIIVINSGTTNNLYGNYFSSLACGANGTVLRNWLPVITNTNRRFNSVIQTITDNCFVTGDSGTILFTNTLNVTANSKLLNSNNISTWYTNNGTFNRNPSSGNGGFEWPKGENKFARYVSGHVIGAIVNGDTLVTVCEYASEYLPGYTDNAGNSQGNGSPEYRNYKLIYDINDSGRLKWPNALLGNSDQGAPVYFDSVSMTFKPSDFGNQTMFYSFTDSYVSSHTYYSGMTSPLKADIKQINWSFNQPEELKNIIYQEYRIINRSFSVWTNAYINLYSDDDLGYATDDAEGVDTVLRLAYTYNFNNVDGVYGINPPSVGFAVIRAPLIFTGNLNDTVFYYEGKNKRYKAGYREMRLGSTVIYSNDNFEPHNYAEMYNAVRGLQNNGSEYINPVTNLPTTFVYSGDPVTNTGWIRSSGDDMRFYQGFGPLNMNPGDTQVIVIAQVIARGSSNLNSITKLREASITAKQFYDNCFENVTIGISNNSKPVPADFYLSQNYPNPFNPVTKISYELRAANFVSVIVYDVLGKAVRTLVNQKQNAGRYEVDFDGSDFASGIYFYSLFLNENLADTKRMMLLK